MTPGDIKTDHYLSIVPGMKHHQSAGKNQKGKPGRPALGDIFAGRSFLRNDHVAILAARSACLHALLAEGV